MQSRIKKKKRVKQFGKVKELLRYREDYMKKKYTIKEIERACRLFLQDMWNDQSEIQALSPKGKEIIWGGIIGKEITKHWLKIKKILV